jgi:hypothetical protein
MTQKIPEPIPTPAINLSFSAAKISSPTRRFGSIYTHSNRPVHHIRSHHKIPRGIHNRSTRHTYNPQRRIPGWSIGNSLLDTLQIGQQNMITYDSYIVLI